MGSPQRGPARSGGMGSPHRGPARSAGTTPSLRSHLRPRSSQERHRLAWMPPRSASPQLRTDPRIRRGIRHVKVEFRLIFGHTLSRNRAVRCAGRGHSLRLSWTLCRVSRHLGGAQSPVAASRTWCDARGDPRDADAGQALRARREAIPCSSYLDSSLTGHVPRAGVRLAESSSPQGEAPSAALFAALGPPLRSNTRQDYGTYTKADPAACCSQSRTTPGRTR
jgi:hypothetical protein